MDGPKVLTPFIKHICARNDGNIIIIKSIIRPFSVGKTILSNQISTTNPGKEPIKAI